MAADGYKDFLAFIGDEKNGFRNLTLPYEGGFVMSVYLPSN